MLRYKKLVVIIALTLLSSTLILVEFTPAAEANPWMADALFGEKAPPGIKINGDGTVEGTNKIVQTNNTTYSLTSDISDSITILKNGITLNGNGHTLHGKSGQRGIFIQGLDGITITNLKIEGCECAIKLAWRHYGDYDGRTIIISHNTFSGNKNAIAFTDHLQGSNITDNCFVANTICVKGAVGVSFRGNQFLDNEYCMPTDPGLNDVDPSNQVNGKPVYYWINQQNMTVPSDASWVVLKHCKNIVVEGLNITRSGGEVQLYNTTDSTIKGNSLSKSGISLMESSGNVIEDNKIADVNHAGVLLQFCRENRVVRNQIVDNDEGVSMQLCDNNTVSQNQLTQNTMGLNMSFIYFNSSASTTLVSQNVISKNSIGIYLYSTNGATITLNNITDNLDWGMKLENNPKNNSIYHNNFIGNNVTDKLQVCITGFWKQIDNGSSVNGTYKPPRRDFVPGEANFWNNTIGGNYWSDYTARYTNAAELGETGVGDKAFYINQNNIDNYPLMTPVDITNTNELLPNQEAAGTNALQNLSLPVLLGIVLAAVVVAGLAVFLWKRRN